MNSIDGLVNVLLAKAREQGIPAEQLALTLAQAAVRYAGSNTPQKIDSPSAKPAVIATTPQIVSAAQLDVELLYRQVQGVRAESFQVTPYLENFIRECMAKVNVHFNAGLVPGDGLNKNRGEYGHAWLILEKQATGTGMMTSYGNSHQDHVERENMHGFEARGDYATLQRVLDTFKAVPQNVKTFMRCVFGWDGSLKGRLSQHNKPDVFQNLKTLHIYDGAQCRSYNAK